MRNFTDPGASPSRPSQFPSSHELSHVSQDSRSLSSVGLPNWKPSQVQAWSCAAWPVHTADPPTETVAFPFAPVDTVTSGSTPMPDEAESSHVHAYPTWLPRHQFRHRHELSRG